MIAREDIIYAQTLAIETGILAADSEVSFCNIGAFSEGNKIRNKLNYLELYKDCLTTILDFTNTGIGDYADLQFTDVQVQKCIDDVYELTSVIFEYKLTQ